MRVFMVFLSAISIAAFAYPDADESVVCRSCMKGQKGDRGYRGWSIRGPKGDPGSCYAQCLNAVDIELCQKLTLRLSIKEAGDIREDSSSYSHEDSSSYSREESSSYSHEESSSYSHEESSSYSRESRSAKFIPVPTGSVFTIATLNKLRRGQQSIDELTDAEASDMLENYCIAMSAAEGQWPGITGDEIQTEKGQKGEKGCPGVGVTGPMGPPGDAGPKGEKGDAGMGIEGPKGMKGCKGDDGDVGPVGHTGDPGPAGPKGAPGSVGQKGNSGLVYIHWGAVSCPAGTQLLHYGYSMWTINKINELICIEEHDKPSVDLPNVQSTFTLMPVVFPDLSDQFDYLQCALCSNDDKATVYTAYGVEKCPGGWTEDYIGFAVSTHASDIICLEQQAAVDINWGSNLSNDLKLIDTYGFNTYDPLPCVVCTK